MEDDVSGLFSFEFHSSFPKTENLKMTRNEDENYPTLHIFGRAADGQSVCVNVYHWYPYVYVRPLDSSNSIVSLISELFERNDKGISAENLSFEIKEGRILYDFSRETATFGKISCCNEFVRKRVIEFFKESHQAEILESHVSFTLQFMSDLGIMGMGQVHVRKLPNLKRRFSRCNVEFDAFPEDFKNNELIESSGCSQSALLPTLGLLLDVKNLGISSFCRDRRNNIDAKLKFDRASVYLSWPFEEVDTRRLNLIPPSGSKLFRYRFKPPSIGDYQGASKVFSEPNLETPLKNSIFQSLCYVPVKSPPKYSKNGSNLIPCVSNGAIIEQLTIEDVSDSPYSLYDFNGSYFLKMIMLECFCLGADEKTCRMPDPAYDSVDFLVFSVYEKEISSVYIWSLKNINLVKKGKHVYYRHFESEEGMLLEFVSFILSSDPDVLVGYEVDSASWGYLGLRYGQIFGNQDIFNKTISRLSSEIECRPDPWLSQTASKFQVYGRIVLNLWRIFRSELALSHYSISSVTSHYFCRNISEFSMSELARMARVNSEFLIDYLIGYIEAVVDLTVKSPFLVKAIEFSRLFGIDLFATLTRGSQYRVESVLVRVAHKEGFILYSPSEQSIHNMRAAECLPLTMEPISGLYTDPVVVLDFQSLYPSIIIAYNYCYSTVLGKLSDGIIKSSGAKIIGPERSEILSTVKHCISPCGVAFATKDEQGGVLPRVLREILTTRIAIKDAMKRCDSKLKSVLDARQFALKYISNVTYGYTSAAFSGRMPNLDIADSIVQHGRQTLENAIKMIEAEDSWNAKVIYGDTDSVFVLLKGRSRAEAFRIGKEIASRVTESNPNPVTLKLEKVYQPCILMSKKRYSGYKYENVDSEPEFEAKGIETVRRDGCGIVSKILEKSLRLIYTGQDIKIVKSYIQRQIVKLFSGSKINFRDFMFAREVRWGTYKSEEDNRLPLAAVAAKLRRSRDKNDVVQYGERVPFFIALRPFKKLYQQVVDHREFFRDSNCKLNMIYYVTKQILPVLSRALLVEGVDVWSWYNELNPTMLMRYRPISVSFFGGDNELPTQSHPYILAKTCRLKQIDSEEHKLWLACRHCCKGFKCNSLTCGTFWGRENFEHLKREEKEKICEFLRNCTE